MKLEAVIRHKSLTYTEHTSANLRQHSEIKLRQEIVRWSQETVECKGTSIHEFARLHFPHTSHRKLDPKVWITMGFRHRQLQDSSKGSSQHHNCFRGRGSFTKFGYRLKFNSLKNIVTILECDYRRGTDCILDLLTSNYRAIADLLILR